MPSRLEVDKHRYDVVGDTAAVRRDESKYRAERSPDDRSDQGHQEAHANGVQQTAEDVMAQLVGPKRVTELTAEEEGRKQSVTQIQVPVVMGGQDVGADPCHDHRAQPDYGKPDEKRVAPP